MRVALGAILIERGVVTPPQLEMALARQKQIRQPLGQTLVDLGLTTTDEILDALSAQFGVPSTRISAYAMDPSVLSAVPEKVARRHLALPLFQVGNTLSVALPNPGDFKALDDLRFASGCEINPVVGLAEEILPALDRHYGDAGQHLPLTDVEGLVVVEENTVVGQREETEADQSAAIRLVDQILARAAGDRASDVHLEPHERGLRVRLRVDGVLADVGTLPQALAPSVTARVKVLAGMDLAERRLPQDGRFRATVAGRRLDLRISTYPTVWGEKCVLRLLDRAALRLQLEEVGLSPEMLGTYRELMRRPEGIVLITGPTGSGKTSTLYATLNELRQSGTLNIVTIENPVEYELDGINQGQTNERAGFTFAKGFRAILRQDPDVVLVGEIRDRETLDVAIEASLTGHLVFSTVHTNSASGTVTRLVEMGLEPYLLTSTLVGVVAQRLVRRLCRNCRKLEPLPPELRSFFPSAPPAELPRGSGCKDCRGSGYRGRRGIFELLRMSDEIRQLVLRRAPEGEIEVASRRAGFPSLYEAGLEMVRAGETTLNEILRVTQARL